MKMSEERRNQSRRVVRSAMLGTMVIAFEPAESAIHDRPLYLPPKNRDWEKRQYRKGKRP
jgi:hypothetical protein